jgi:two-component system, NarL family, nitrate/nitrite response regulator NarL
VTTSVAPDESRVAIVDDHALFAETLQLALSREGYAATRVGVPDEAVPTASDVLRKLLELKPDVLLLDLDLGAGGDGFALIEPTTKAGIDVVVVTGADEPGQWARAVMTGARKVLSKSGPLAEVVSTVRRITAGQSVMDNDERQALLDAWVARRAGNEEVWERFDLLTLRESEILGLMMQGRTAREIARTKDIAEGTVRSHVKAILAKLQVSSQLAAVGLAYQLDWHTPFPLPAATPDDADEEWGPARS